MDHAQPATTPLSRRSKRTSASKTDPAPIAPDRGPATAPATEGKKATRLIATTGWYDLSEEAYHADPCPALDR